MSKRLSNKLTNSIKSGLLKGLISKLNDSPGVNMEIRKNYISVYYKGGQLLKISEAQAANNVEKFRLSWDEKYLKPKSILKNSLPKQYVSNNKEVNAWQEIIPELKKQMEFFWSNGKKTIEKFIQQDIVINKRLTNHEIIDFEYQKGTHARFDLLGVNKTNGMLSFIELKQGESALSSDFYITKKKEKKRKSGLLKHYTDITDAIINNKELHDEKSKATHVINEKRDLLLTGTPTTEINSINAYEILFVLANYNKKSEYLEREIKQIFELHNSLEFQPKLNLLFLEFEIQKNGDVKFDETQIIESIDAFEYGKQKEWI